MKLVAMVSWWDEGPELLDSCFLGMAKLGVHTAIAIDGVLDLYPSRRANSHPDRYRQMIQRADDCDIDLLVLRNQRRWVGNEVGKRQFMLDVALAITKDEDWLLVWDTDYVLLNYGSMKDSLHHDLRHTELNYCDLAYGEEIKNLYKARVLMRARRGLHLRRNHYAYFGPNGDESWFLTKDDDGVALQRLDIQIHHNRELRSQERLEGRTEFYRLRDELGVEK